MIFHVKNKEVEFDTGGEEVGGCQGVGGFGGGVQGFEGGLWGWL